jgi:hypothetical protein
LGDEPICRAWLSVIDYGADFTARRNPNGSDLLASEVDGVRGALLGHASEADNALPLELQAVVAYERFLSVGTLHESAVCALIDQYKKLVMGDLDAGVQARDEVTLYDHVTVVGTADGDARVPFIHQQLAVTEPQTQSHAARRMRITRDPGRYCGFWIVAHTLKAVEAA